MKFKKRNFLWLLGFCLVFAIPLVSFLPSFITKLNQKSFGWNFLKFRNQIEKKEDFIAYFGTSKCSHCLKFGEEMKKEKWNDFFFNQEKTKNLLYWYYDDKDVGSQEQKTFVENINNLIEVNPKIKVATPQLLFFKKRKLRKRWVPKSEDWDQELQTIKNYITWYY